MTYGAYFFDFDLTLADSREGITKCFRGVLSRHGFTDVTDDAIVSTVGHSMADSFTLLTGETDPVVIEGWRHEFRVFSERWMNTHTYASISAISSNVFIIHSVAADEDDGAARP